MRALLLGNSPALLECDPALIPRESVHILGVNRILEWIKPDTLVMLDSNIKPEWIPVDGEVQGVLTYPGCKALSHHPQRIVRALHKVRIEHRESWPAAGEPYLNSRNTAGFAFQYLVELGYTEIGILGVDYNHRALIEQGKDAEYYGQNPITRRGTTMDAGAMSFWTLAREHCEAHGISVHNLTVYDDAPFHRAGFQRMAFEDWCANVTVGYNPPNIPAPPPPKPPIHPKKRKLHVRPSPRRRR